MPEKELPPSHTSVNPQNASQELRTLVWDVTEEVLATSKRDIKEAERNLIALARKEDADFSKIEQSGWVRWFSQEAIHEIADIFFRTRKVEDALLILRFLPATNLDRLALVLSVAIAAVEPDRTEVLRRYLVYSSQSKSLEEIYNQLQKIVSTLPDSKKKQRVITYASWAFWKADNEIYTNFQTLAYEYDDDESREYFTEYLYNSGRYTEATEQAKYLYNKNKNKYQHLIPVLVKCASSAWLKESKEYAKELSSSLPWHVEAMCEYYFRLEKEADGEFRALYFHAKMMEKEKSLSKEKRTYGLSPLFREELMQYATNISSRLPKVPETSSVNERMIFPQLTDTIGKDLFALRTLALSFGNNLDATVNYWEKIYGYLFMTRTAEDTSLELSSNNRALRYFAKRNFIPGIVDSFGRVYNNTPELLSLYDEEYVDNALWDVLHPMLVDEAEETMQKYDYVEAFGTEDEKLVFSLLCSIIAQAIRVTEEYGELDERNPEKTMPISEWYENRSVKLSSYPGIVAHPGMSYYLH